MVVGPDIEPSRRAVMWQQAVPVSAFAQRKFRDRRQRRRARQCVRQRTGAAIRRSMSGAWRCAGAEGRPQRFMQVERGHRSGEPERNGVMLGQVGCSGGKRRRHRHRADEAGMQPAVMIVVAVRVVMVMAGMIVIRVVVVGVAQREMDIACCVACRSSPVQVAERQHEAERQRKQRQACPELRSRSKPPHRSASDPHLVQKPVPKIGSPDVII